MFIYCSLPFVPDPCPLPFLRPWASGEQGYSGSGPLCHLECCLVARRTHNECLNDDTSHFSDNLLPPPPPLSPPPFPPPSPLAVLIASRLASEKEQSSALIFAGSVRHRWAG